MIVVFFWNYLNHHQLPVADAMYDLLGDNFRFVATLPRDEKELKGGVDYSNRPYCVLAGESDEVHKRALMYAEVADVCVFGACSQEYAVHRATLTPEALSFECGERWLKRGWLNVLSPVLRQWWMNYMRYYRKANFHKLCSSAFAAQDDEKLGCYKGRHYKWAYFTSVPETCSKCFNCSTVVRLMWCARFLKLKHPVLPVLMASRLKEEGYSFVLDFYGDGEELEPTRKLTEDLELTGCVKFHGAVPNKQVLEAMQEHDIFLFTSDRLEGWGAVVNEALSNGCAVVGSDAIGSVPYLIKDGVNGYKFKSGDVDSLCEKVKCLIGNRELLQKMQTNAVNQMQDVWSPANAAKSLLQLIEDLQNGKDTSVKEGPCSKA